VDAKRRSEDGVRRLFCQADADKLPYREASVDTVYIANMFGDDSAFPGNMLSEVKRVLKEDGEFVVLESNTPWDSGAFDVVKGDLEHLGFSIKKTVRLNDDNWKEETGKYDQWIFARPGAYMIVAIPVKHEDPEEQEMTEADLIRELERYREEDIKRAQEQGRTTFINVDRLRAKSHLELFVDYANNFCMFFGSEIYRKNVEKYLSSPEVFLEAPTLTKKNPDERKQYWDRQVDIVRSLDEYLASLGEEYETVAHLFDTFDLNLEGEEAEKRNRVYMKAYLALRNQGFTYRELVS